MVEKRISLEKDGALKKLKENQYSFNLSNTFSKCPQLKDSRCMIHENPKRPKACNTFPIFVNEDEKVIHFSSRCHAIAEKKLYKFEHDFIKAGYKLD